MAKQNTSQLHHTRHPMDSVIHTDIFLFLNGKQSGELDRIWYDAGVEYRIDKKNSIECKVREEHLMSKTPQQLNTFISLGYKLKL